jgi:hypothetical protein
MRHVIGLGALALALAGCSSVPGRGNAGNHAAHHPAGGPSRMAPPAGYEQQMKSMHEMHQKMAAAKTPEERAALMKDHMKTMHDGMAMMGQMRGMMGGGMGMGAREPGSGTADADMMRRRMDMMDMMMQMMMDREQARPPVPPR